MDSGSAGQATLLAEIYCLGAVMTVISGKLFSFSALRTSSSFHFFLSTRLKRSSRLSVSV
jgi:hypothetical protein